MSVDQTPSPASVDIDPPAYSQPTLPPPANEPVMPPPAISRWGTRILAGGLLAVGAMTVAAWSLLPHGEPTAAAATASIAQMSKVTVDLGSLAHTFPSQVSETACSDSADRVPVVLLSSMRGEPTGLEKELFSNASLVQGPSLTITGRRIAVVRTSENHEPEASATTDPSGHYQGTVVVFDAVTRQPLCQTHIDAVSKRDLRWANVSAGAMHKDYVDSVRQALTESAGRLHVDLDL